MTTVPSTYKIIQICQNTPRVSKYFINQYLKTEKWAIETKSALLFHAVKHCIGNNYS
jgi:hypothetical protein